MRAARIRAAGKRVREDFMKYVWINDVLIAGARQLLGRHLTQEIHRDDSSLAMRTSLRTSEEAFR